MKLAACILTCTILEATIASARNERKPLKLTMKQGLVMNQVIGTFTLNEPRDPLCKKHMEEYRIGLRAMETWALRSE